MGFINVKGTHDIFANEANEFTALELLMKQIASVFAFKEVRPPVLEHSELFARGVGESSDIVRKEMYTFDDKAGRSLTLRPEFTAGIIRLIVQNKLLNLNELPLKTYYCGPVFRYDRPQLGRYRQFNQFGVESVGSNNPLSDLEVIVLAYTILSSIGLNDVTIQINTLGDEESRNNYKKALKDYFGKHIENMCPDCKQRYELNPLRILDCKVPEYQKIVSKAPKMSKYLSDNAKKNFKYLLSVLDDLQIPYEVDDTLVRGLDYYSETVFEFKCKSSKGVDYGAIGGGGHYDKLVKEVGGPDLPGCGFSFGLERIVSILKDDDKFPKDIYDELDFYVMPLGMASQKVALNIVNELRLNGFTTDMCFDDVKIANMFKRAEKKNSKFAIILGENEIKAKKVLIKNLKTQEQIECDIDHLNEQASELLENHHHECCCDGEDCDDPNCHCHDKKEN